MTRASIKSLTLYTIGVESDLSEAYTVELQWLEHLWDHDNLFETGVVRVNEC